MLGILHHNRYFYSIFPLSLQIITLFSFLWRCLPLSCSWSPKARSKESNRALLSCVIFDLVSVTEISSSALAYFPICKLYTSPNTSINYTLPSHFPSSYRALQLCLQITEIPTLEINQTDVSESIHHRAYVHHCSLSEVIYHINYWFDTVSITFVSAEDAHSFIIRYVLALCHAFYGGNVASPRFWSL